MSQPDKPRFVKRYSTAILSMLRQGYQDDQPEELTLQAEYSPEGLLIREWRLAHGETSPEQHSYEYDQQGRLLKHRLVIEEDGIEESFVTTRNADGQAVEIRKFYGDDPGEYTTYRYAENGEVAEVVAHDADGEFEQRETLTYDNQKRMTSRIIEKADGEKQFLKYEYNEQGLLATVTETDAAGKLITRQEHDYTMEGLDARIRQWNGDGKLLTDIVSVYNDLGLLISKTTIGFYTRITRFEYDEAGNVTEESLSDENDFVISRTRMEYDANNRLVNETIYETDLTRAGRDTHYTNRYEYEFN